MRRGFSASGTTRSELHDEQAVLQLGALDLDVVGEHEAALERPAGDAAVEQVTLLALGLDLAGDEQRVVLHRQLEVVLAEAGDRHHEAIAVLAGALDVVGRIGRRGRGLGGAVHQARETVEADRGTEKGREIDRS